MSELAINGGPPVRHNVLPYGRQSVDQQDIQAVERVLRSDWLTTGPQVAQFEDAFARLVGTRYAVAVSSGTAALHAIVAALDIAAGDEVIVPAITFAASANCVVYQGGQPVFVDVEPDTLLIDVSQVEDKLAARTRAIVAVDYAGQACDYAELGSIARQHGVALVADACHALGGSYRGRQVGRLADLSAFSLHPVKPITAGEGGVVTTDDDRWVARIRAFRNHGITQDHRERETQGTWYYEMVELGYNYRLTDLQCALGLSQLQKLPGWIARRQDIAQQYTSAFADLPQVQPLATRPGVSHAYHLYVVQLDLAQLRVGRAQVFAALRAEGIGVNVHYLPVYLHPFYRRRFGTGPGLCPRAEAAYERILSLPIFPAMSDADVEDVIEAVHKVIRAYTR